MNVSSMNTTALKICNGSLSTKKSIKQVTTPQKHAKYPYAKLEIKDSSCILKNSTFVKTIPPKEQFYPLFWIFTILLQMI